MKNEYEKKKPRSLQAISTYLVIIFTWLGPTSLFSKISPPKPVVTYSTGQYDQIRVQQVRISRKRHLTCLSQTILNLAPILERKKTQKIVRTVLDKTKSYKPILLRFNCNHKVEEFYNVFKFEVNRTKTTAVRVQHTKMQNSRRLLHKIEIAKIWETSHWPISSRLTLWNFIEFGSAIWAVELT